MTRTCTRLRSCDLTRHERIPITAPARTRSPLERKLLNLIRQSDLPEPETDRWIGPYLVDFLWPEKRVVVETDGLAFHSHNRARRKDRARTNSLQLGGYTVLRFTWEDVTKRPDRILSEMRFALRTAL